MSNVNKSTRSTKKRNIEVIDDLNPNIDLDLDIVLDGGNLSKPNKTNKPGQKKKQTLNVPWIEKYRPRKPEDLVLEENTLKKIKMFIDDKIMPNIIITGLPGIGKTTTILCIAHNLLGKYFDQGVIELNASDDRGIKAIQDNVIYFCKKKLDLKDEPNRQYAKHKIVLLDEADNMTKKAQQLVNNLMEKYRNTTRFAFTCNNSSDIIEAIQSRCIILRYIRLSNEQIGVRLKHICELEKVPYTDEGIQSLVITAQGDLRQAINNLQLTYNGYTKVVPENVYKLCDKPHPLVIQNILLACKEKNLRSAVKKTNDLLEKGYSSSDLSASMINTLKSMKIDGIDEKTKIYYLTEISKACMIINRGMNTPLQLTGCIASLCQ